MVVGLGFLSLGFRVSGVYNLGFWVLGFGGCLRPSAVEVLGFGAPGRQSLAEGLDLGPGESAVLRRQHV